MTDKQSKILTAEVERQIEELNTQLNSLKESLSSSTKSSAGDKHETSRAHVQLEMEQLGKQLALKERMRSALQNSLRNSITDEVKPGCFVKTSIGNFIVSIALGKIEELDVIVISPASPMAKELLEKRVGDNIFFNGNSIKVISIE